MIKIETVMKRSGDSFTYNGDKYVLIEYGEVYPYGNNVNYKIYRSSKGRKEIYCKYSMMKIKQNKYEGIDKIYNIRISDFASGSITYINY